MEEARPLLRACLECLAETLRSDMEGGDESVELVRPLTVLSYADMLAGMNDADPFSSETHNNGRFKCMFSSIEGTY